MGWLAGWLIGKFGLMWDDDSLACRAGKVETVAKRWSLGGGEVGDGDGVVVC